MSDVSSEQWGIVANVCDSDSALRLGARVWIVNPFSGWHTGFVEVRGISRGGRTIQKWISRQRLQNYRSCWLRPDTRWIFGWPSRGDAEHWARKFDHKMTFTHTGRGADGQ